jgi:hypothetical protein
MAKEQGLALNPQKISGTCGRLMCCLAYEHEHYREIRSDLPRFNAQVNTPRGVGKVTKLNVLAQQVEVTIPELPSPLWFAASELSPVQAEHGCCAMKEEGTTCGGCARHAQEPSLPAVEEPEAAEPAMPQDGAAPKRRPRRRGGRKHHATVPPSETPAAVAVPAPPPPPAPAFASPSTNSLGNA